MGKFLRKDEGRQAGRQTNKYIETKILINALTRERINRD